MSQAAKAQEPSMEEILASIRRIIADDDATKASAPPPPPPKPAPAPPPKIAQPAPPPPPPKPAPAPAAAAAKEKNNQDDIDAMLAELDAMPAQKEPPPPPPPPPPPAPAAPEKDDILDLTEAMAKPEPASGFRTIDGKSDVVFNEAPEKPAPRPSPATSMVDLARRQFEQELGGPTLMSANTTAAVDSAFNTLAHTVLSENARTLEDLVKEMLRPMLKAWLDDNLPGMVERLVRAEIERVSRGRNK
jgi:cell pole-organizing protein PopZ